MAQFNCTLLGGRDDWDGIYPRLEGFGRLPYPGGILRSWSGTPPLHHFLKLNSTLGFFPGCVYLISAWYVRYEVQKR